MNRTVASVIFLALATPTSSAQRVSSDFTFTGLVWPGSTPEIPFQVSASLIGSVPYDAPFPAAVHAIRNAAERWNVEGRANVRLTFAGLTAVRDVADDGINAILYEDGPCPYAHDGLMATFLHRRGSVVHGFDVVIYRGGLLRGRNFWTARTALYPWETDLEGVITHEFGHVLGLGHSERNATVMSSPCHRPTLSTRHLTRSDVEGLQVLYGTESSHGLTVTPVNPVPGDDLVFALDCPQAAGRPFLLLASARDDRIPLRMMDPGDSRLLALDPQYVPVTDVLGRTTQGFGVLDLRGRASCRVRIPANDAYAGMTLHVTLLTFDPHHLNGLLDVGPARIVRIGVPASVEAHVGEDPERDR